MNQLILTKNDKRTNKKQACVPEKEKTQFDFRVYKIRTITARWVQNIDARYYCVRIKFNGK